MAAGARRSLLPRAACRIGAGDPDRHAPHPRIEPDITIWFHQPLALVDASGDLRVERRYARLVGLPLVHLGRLHGTATSWQKHVLRATEAFVVELPGRASPSRGPSIRAGGVPASYPHAADAKDRHIDTVPNLTERDAPDVRMVVYTSTGTVCVEAVSSPSERGGTMTDLTSGPARHPPGTTIRHPTRRGTSSERSSGRRSGSRRTATEPCGSTCSRTVRGAQAPRGMVGLRLSHTTRRLTSQEILALLTPRIRVRDLELGQAP